MVEESFIDVLKTIQTARHLEVTYGRVRGADMDIHDPVEQDLLDENPLTVLIEFGKLIGIGLTILFSGKTSCPFPVYVENQPVAWEDYVEYWYKKARKHMGM